MDRHAPILVFDSGVGGLTVYDQLRAILPDAPVIYAADLAGMPYGTKTEAQIAARVAGLLGRMSERFAPRLVCIACNTASTIALGMVRDVLEVPIVGTVPAIKPAARATKTGIIGLLGTQATIRQDYVDQLEREFAADKRLLRLAAPALVDCAEQKMRGEDVDRRAIIEAAERLREMAGEMAGQAQIDTLVLACTHFPLLADELAREFGENVQLIDGAAGIARRVAHLVEGQEWEAAGPDRFVVTTKPYNIRGLQAMTAARGFAPIERF